MMADGNQMVAVGRLSDVFKRQGHMGRVFIDIDHNPFVACLESGDSRYRNVLWVLVGCLTTHCLLHGSRSSALEPIIQIVPILSPALFIERIGYGCDLPLIPPRYRLSVQRGLVFLDNFFLRRWTFYGYSLLHLKSSSFPSAT
jgi:hypothetical protein